MSTSVRTTILLPPALLQRLRNFATKRGKPMSKIVEAGIKQIIDTDQTTQLGQMYKTLKELDGAGGTGVSDASTTINATLYGDHGAWKEHHA